MSVHPAHRKFTLSPLNLGYAVRDGDLLRPEHRPSRVAIYGFGDGREAAPLRDPQWEVWALNLIPPIDLYGRVRADRWFDIHQRSAQSADDLEWIAKCPVPIYVPGDLVTAGPMCVRYPIEKVVSTFGANYFSCTFAYQIALAMLEGFKEIGLFGVELRLGTMRERTVEWACVSWWMGFANAAGVTVTVPSGSWLQHHPALYGLEYDAEASAVQEYVNKMREIDRLYDDFKSVGG